MVRWPVLLCVCAVGCVAFRPPPMPDKVPEPDTLALAADALDRGDDRAACLHLAAHLLAQPDDAATRVHLAELLFKQRRFAEARTEFEVFVATAQPMAGPIRRQLLHAHTRLMLIAEGEHDEYAESLHRGIGLIVLVESWDADAARRDETAANETLTKAVRALRAARTAKPERARANLYLSIAYERMGQLSAARSARRGAEAAAPFDLTPWERERLAKATEQ